MEKTRVIHALENQPLEERVTHASRRKTFVSAWCMVSASERDAFSVAYRLPWNEVVVPASSRKTRFVLGMISSRLKKNFAPTDSPRIVGALFGILRGKTPIFWGSGSTPASPGSAGGCESFFKKIVDPKIETAINTAPQVRGPFKTVFAKSDSGKEICKKLLTMTET